MVKRHIIVTHCLNCQSETLGPLIWSHQLERPHFNGPKAFARWGAMTPSPNPKKMVPLALEIFLTNGCITTSVYLRYGTKAL